MSPTLASSNSTLSLFGDMPVSTNAEALSKISKIIATRKQNTESRNKRIRERFNDLYRAEIPDTFVRSGDPVKDRFDYVYAELQKEFALAKSTIENALRS